MKKLLAKIPKLTPGRPSRRGRAQLEAAIQLSVELCEDRCLLSGTGDPGNHGDNGGGQ